MSPKTTFGPHWFDDAVQRRCFSLKNKGFTRSNNPFRGLFSDVVLMCPWGTFEIRRDAVF